MPHPFHVLCEMGGKPQNLPPGNYENAPKVRRSRVSPVILSAVGRVFTANAVEGPAFPSYTSPEYSRDVKLVVAAPALVGAGNIHIFTIFRHRAARQLNALRL